MPDDRFQRKLQKWDTFGYDASTDLQNILLRTTSWAHSVTILILYVKTLLPVD